MPQSLPGKPHVPMTFQSRIRETSRAWNVARGVLVRGHGVGRLEF